MNGESVPIDRMSEHMRVSLLDPKWKEQKQMQDERRRESSFAVGEEITSSLQSLAKKRDDIFETARKEEEEQTAKKAENVVQWSGHTASAERAMREQVCAKSYLMHGNV